MRTNDAQPVRTVIMRATPGVQPLMDGGVSGMENMRRDLELLRRCAGGALERAVRLYWFEPPCLSLGRLEPESDVDIDACARDGIDVVRRPSGGRAVLHEDEVTYAVVCRIDDQPFGGDVLTSCARIHGAIAAGLRLLGIETVSHELAAPTRRAARAAAVADCFARPSAHELLDSGGRKLVGSAQARRGGALLQHGSVLLSPSRAARYLRTSSDGAGNRASAPAAPSPGLRALAGRPLTREDVTRAMSDGFTQMLGA